MPKTITFATEPKVFPTPGGGIVMPSGFAKKTGPTGKTAGVISKDIPTPDPAPREWQPWQIDTSLLTGETTPTKKEPKPTSPWIYGMAGFGLGIAVGVSSAVGLYLFGKFL